LVLIVTAPLVTGEFFLKHFGEVAVIPGLPKLCLLLRLSIACAETPRS
jgi:hypothetical protein